MAIILTGGYLEMAKGHYTSLVGRLEASQSWRPLQSFSRGKFSDRYILGE